MDPWVSLASQRKVTRLTVPIRWNEHGVCVYAYTTAIFPISIHALLLTPCRCYRIYTLHTLHTLTLSDGTRMLSESSIHPTCEPVCVCGWKSTASFNLAELIVLCFSLLLHMTKCVMCIERHCTHTHTIHTVICSVCCIFMCVLFSCVFASFAFWWCLKWND